MDNLMSVIPETVPAPTQADVPVPAAPPSAEPATPTAPEPRGSTYQEQKFFAQREASSLPPQEPPTQEPVPAIVPPPAPPVDEPVATATDAVPAVEPPPIVDDFSAEIPDLQPEDGVLLDTSIPHPDFPLGDDAPPWTHDAFDRIKQDQNLTDEEKKTIAALPPTAWDKARRWQRDTKLLGKFRDEQVPIADVFETLTKQSKERAAQLEVEALNRVLSNPDKMVTFAEQHTPVFAQVMSELVNTHSDFVAAALKKRGFNVVKAEPINIEQIKADLKSHPLYSTFEDTDLDQLINSKLDQIASLVGNGEVSPEELAAEMQKTAPASNNEAAALFQAVGTEIRQAQTNHWLKSIGDGLQAAGIKPATAEEKSRNPAVAHLKDVVFNMALHGLPGVLSDWDTHSAKWGEKQPGYSETFTELQKLAQSGDIDGFRANAPSMNSFYYEFGKSRANIGLIQSLYRAINNLSRSEATPAPTPSNGTVPPGTPAPTVADPSSGSLEQRGTTLSEKRFFAALGK